jgi:hypothetical protein
MQGHLQKSNFSQAIDWQIEGHHELPLPGRSRFREAGLAYYFVSVGGAGGGVMFQVSIRIFQPSPSRVSIADQ